MIKRILASLSIFIISFQSAQAAEQATLKIHVEGLDNDKGVVRMALFNSEASYSKDKGGVEAFTKAKSAIQNGEAEHDFTELPYGDYAVKLFHDVDDSGKIKTNMLGMPKEQFGFSNNAKASFGPPDFQKVKFTLNSAVQSMTIKMQN